MEFLPEEDISIRVLLVLYFTAAYWLLLAQIELYESTSESTYRIWGVDISDSAGIQIFLYFVQLTGTCCPEKRSVWISLEEKPKNLKFTSIIWDTAVIIGLYTNICIKHTFFACSTLITESKQKPYDTKMVLWDYQAN